jgi:hypothetical protein
VKQLIWAITLIGLGYPTAIAADAPENNPKLEIFYGERTPILVKEKVIKAVAADTSLLEVELSEGQLFITAHKSGQTMLYIWSEQGIQVYTIKSLAAHRIDAQVRPQRAALKRSPTSLSGSYGAHINTSLGRSLGPWFLGHNISLDYPLEGQQRLFSRASQTVQLSPTNANSRVSIPFFQAAYQSPSLRVNLGNLNYQQPLQFASGLGSSLRGGHISLTQTQSRYDAFIGEIALPWVIWSEQSQPQSGAKRPILAGGSGSWRIPLSLFDQAGTLDFQGLAASEIAPTLQPTFAGGITWNHPQSQLQLALGSRANAIGVLAQTFYNHSWPEFQSNLNIGGQYRHFGAGYQRPSSEQEDQFNLRTSSRWREWGLSGSIRIDLLAGTWNKYQLSTRLNRQIKSLATNIYAQGNSNALGLERHQYQGRLGLRWQQGLPGHTSYQWQLNQSPVYPDSHTHQLQMQLRLFQNKDWQIWANANSNLQGLGIENQTLWSQQLFLRANRTFSPEWQWQNGLSYNLAIPFIPREWPQTVQFQSGLNWTSALQQARIMANYQYYHQGSGSHIWGLSGNYVWRFGYEEETRLTQLQGRVYHDVNHNGLYDEGEPGLEQVQLQVGNHQIITTNAQGQYELDTRQGSLKLSVQIPSLPPGYQIIGPSTLELQRDGNAPIIANFAARNQMSIQGYAFASPLLYQGLANVEIMVDGKHTLITSGDGRFDIITQPGRHELRINPMSIPHGYRLQGPLSRSFDSLTNQRIDFVFIPYIRLELQCVTDTGKPIAGIKAYLATDEEEIEVEVSDTQGMLTFNVPAGSARIIFPELKQGIEVSTGDQPGTIKQKHIVSPISDK